jgi:hypothetical protein
MEMNNARVGSAEVESLQSFVLRRLSEDDTSLRVKIYELVMEYTTIHNIADTKVVTEDSNSEDLQVQPTKSRFQNSEYQYLVAVIHSLMLERGFRERRGK